MSNIADIQPFVLAPWRTHYAVTVASYSRELPGSTMAIEGRSTDVPPSTNLLATDRRLTTSLLRQLFRALVPVALACGGCQSDSSQGPTRVAPTPPSLGAHTLIEGTDPGLPEAVLEHVALGKEPSTKIAAGRSVLVPRYENPFLLRLDAQGRVQMVSYPADGEGLITAATAAWGPGTTSEDSTNAYAVWLSSAALNRVLINPDGLFWTSYLPFAEFLGSGDGIAAFAATEGTLLGLTRDDLERHYGPLTSPTGEDAELLKAVGDRGVDPQFLGLMSERLGMSSLDFPPTEYADVTTNVHVGFDSEGKVDHCWFDVPYGSHTTAAAQILDVAAQKWLDEAPPPDPAMGDGPAEFTMSDNPAIQMNTTMERTWQFHVRVPAETGSGERRPKKAR